MLPEDESFLAGGLHFALSIVRKTFEYSRKRRLLFFR
jgi:hypothetical protein